MDSLILSILTALKITFIYAIFNWEGMLFTKAGRIVEYRVNRFIAKPVITCQICMTSFWGIIFWFSEGYSIYEMADALELIKFLLVVGGINVIISLFTGPKQLENMINGG